MVKLVALTATILAVAQIAPAPPQSATLPAPAPTASATPVIAGRSINEAAPQGPAPPRPTPRPTPKAGVKF